MDIKRKHFWIDLIVMVASIACGLALLIASLGAAAGAAAGDTETGQASEPASAQREIAAQTQTQTMSPREAALPQAAEQQTYEGIVTCSTCGAKHAADINKSAADCTRVCVHGGAKFALVDGEKTYMLEGDLNQLKRIAGQRAQIMGSMQGNTITISSIVSKT
jgi:hypothetical protein